MRRALPSLCGNNKLLSVLLLLLLLSSQVFWQRATSDSDLINSEVGLTAKHQASGPLGLPDDAAEEMGKGKEYLVGGVATHSFCCGLCAVCWGKL